MRDIQKKWNKQSSTSHSFRKSLWRNNGHQIAKNPIYDKKGNLLGLDSNGWDGEAIVMTKESYQFLTNKNTETLKHSDALTLIKSGHAHYTQDTRLSPNAYIKIKLSMLDGFVLPNGVELTHSNVVIKTAPVGDLQADTKNSTDSLYHVKVNDTGRMRAAELTRANVRSFIGIHEIYGHIILGLRTHDVHWKVYALQNDHSSFSAVTDAAKGTIMTRIYDFYYHAHNETVGIPARYLKDIHKYYDAKYR